MDTLKQHKPLRGKAEKNICFLYSCDRYSSHNIVRDTLEMAKMRNEYIFFYA